MNPTRPSDVAALLRELDFVPSRVLGQNFLIDGNILSIILESASVTPVDQVLEIGAGLGVLTTPLLDRAGTVTAVEKDDRLFAYLQTALGGHAGLSLVHADVLDLDLPAMVAAGITRVVANLPYGVASRVLVELALAPSPPTAMVITVQKEVADRLAAPPGGKTYGALSVFAQLAYRATIRKTIRPSCFLPPPQIDSALVVLRRRDPAPSPAPARFRDMVKHVFSQRRKQLGTIFRQAPAGLGLDADRLQDVLTPFDLTLSDRPEIASPEAFLALAESLANDPGR